MKDKKLNILVTGGNGQLGRCLRDASKGSSNRYIFSDINEFPGL
jgi:dTDP-4-dehydrorhamnose reductase